jgi:VWFA-related protein
MSLRSSIIRIATALLVVAVMPSIAWSAGDVGRGAHVRGILPTASNVIYDSVSGRVRVEVSPEQVAGLRIPELRRDRFVVFENGVRQQDVKVEIEHRPVTLAVLVENGGHSSQLNSAVASEAEMIIRPLFEVLGPEDTLGVFAYDDSLHTVIDFGMQHDQWKSALSDMPKAHFSEANFYDATASLLDRLTTVSGQKAIVMLTTGIDTFSKADFETVRAKAQQAGIPIYVFGLGELARQRLAGASWGPLARVDWSRCERQLAELARTSHGGSYLRASAVDAQGIFDEIMENLRVRYALSYVPSSMARNRHDVAVALIDPPNTVDAARIVETSRHRAAPRIVATGSYTPAETTARAEFVASEVIRERR